MEIILIFIWAAWALSQDSNKSEVRVRSRPTTKPPIDRGHPFSAKYLEDK